jgi:hypothetical protein
VSCKTGANPVLSVRFDPVSRFTCFTSTKVPRIPSCPSALTRYLGLLALLVPKYRESRLIRALSPGISVYLLYQYQSTANPVLSVRFDTVSAKLHLTSATN